MNKWSAYLIAGCVLSCTALQAEFNLEDAGSEHLDEGVKSATESRPFTITASGDWISNAKVQEHHAGRLIYDHTDVAAKAVVWYNECYKEGVQLGVGYDHTRLNWNANPFFARKNYNDMNILGAFFTHRLPDWRWIASVQYNIDADKWNFNQYSTWDLLLWGRYEYNCRLGVHLGIYAQTGMKMDRAWPVLGFDWKISRNWKLNAIFPLNVSLVYTLNDHWSLAVAGRFFNDRHRAGEKGYYKKAVWRYTNTGIEGAINYTAFCGKLTANVHAGYALGGRLRIADQHNHHPHHRKFDGSPYAGAEVDFNF